MSLDVSLYKEVKKICIHCNSEYMGREELYEANITHNLNTMAERAGIYDCIWRPEENDFTKAKDLIMPLTEGLERLKSSPDIFTAMEPENKWGTYKYFVPWVERYLEACKEYPDAKIWVSR